MNTDFLTETNPFIPEADRNPDHAPWAAFLDFLNDHTPPAKSTAFELYEQIADPTLAQLCVSYMWNAFQAGFDTASD